MITYPIVNTHCHFLHFGYVPDKLFKILSHVDEKLVKDRNIQAIAKAITHDFPLFNYRHLVEVLQIYCSNNIEKVAAWHIQNMKKAGIQLCTPLMMDLEPCFKSNAITHNEDYIPYYTEDDQPGQIQQVSQIAAKYPWQVFPFIMFDPRRTNAVEICKFALENQGFIGIKLYPPLGYFPVPTIRQSQQINDALKAMYDYCGKERIPITIHCSTAGAYAQGNPNWDDIWEKTAPFQWYETLRKYELKVNFAHFGGSYIKHPLDQKTQKSLEWRLNILTLMRATYRMNLIDSKESAFADVSFHSLSHSHDQELKNEYFDGLKKCLNDQHYQSQILYGSDASMCSPIWDESEFIQPFVIYLNEEEQKRLFCENPLKFLFENGEISKKYIKFLEKTAPQSLQNHALPSWLVKQDNRFVLNI